MTLDSVDVVVIGAGAVGAACAFQLALAGLKVVVLEQEAVAAGSSTCATGAMNNINGDFNTPEFLQWGIDGIAATLRLVPILEDLAQMDTQCQVRSAMRLAIDEDEEQQVRADFEWQRAVMGVQWLDADAIRAIEPRISAEVRGGVLEPGAAQIPAPRLTHAFMRAAERFGAVLLPTQATGLRRGDDRVQAVTHRNGTVNCDWVVLAMGAFSRIASSWLDFEIKTRPLLGERLMLRYPERPFDLFVTTPRRGHIISRLDGFLSIGSTGGRDFDDRGTWLVDEEEAQAETHPTPSDSARDELLARAAEVIPSIARSSVAERIAGFRPYSPDQKPIIGVAPTCSNVVIATGHSHRGIQLAAITGELVRDIIVHCRPAPSTTGAGIFSPTRFDAASIDTPSSSLLSAQAES